MAKTYFRHELGGRHDGRVRPVVRDARRARGGLVSAITALEIEGPNLGRPLVDTVKGSKHPNMKELRRRSFRILFAFDPDRVAVLLVGGDKEGQWNRWYKRTIKLADRLFDERLRRRRR